MLECTTHHKSELAYYHLTDPGFTLLIGRCYYDMICARKIVYPDDAKYIDDDITHKGTRSVDFMLKMDLVHFSSELDVELARKYSQQY